MEILCRGTECMTLHRTRSTFIEGVKYSQESILWAKQNAIYENDQELLLEKCKRDLPIARETM
jgi:hypothetical protein